MNTAIIIIYVLAFAFLTLWAWRNWHKNNRAQSAFWQQQFRNFMTQRGIISWGEAQFIPNNPKEEYVTRMTGYKPTNRYWKSLDEAWRKRVEMMEED